MSKISNLESEIYININDFRIETLCLRTKCSDQVRACVSDLDDTNFHFHHLQRKVYYSSMELEISTFYLYHVPNEFTRFRRVITVAFPNVYSKFLIVIFIHFLQTTPIFSTRFLGISLFSFIHSCHYILKNMSRLLLRTF